MLLRNCLRFAEYTPFMSKSAIFLIDFLSIQRIFLISKNILGYAKSLGFVEIS